MLKLVFTRHARNRMRWRKIPKDEVEKAIGNPVLTTTDPLGGENAYVKIGSKYLKVAYSREEGKVVVISAVYKNALPKGGR